MLSKKKKKRKEEREKESFEWQHTWILSPSYLISEKRAPEVHRLSASSTLLHCMASMGLTGVSKESWVERKGLEAEERSEARSQGSLFPSTTFWMTRRRLLVFFHAL